jgi:uncharacterized membrane protein
MNRKQILNGVLLLSLTINLIFIGGMATRYFSMEDRAGSRPLPPNVGWIVRDLSEERRQELAPVLRQSFEESMPVRREMFAAQRRVNRLMSAQPFDDAALELAFQQLRELNIGYQQLSHQQTGIILNELSDEERRAAMEFVQRRGPRDGRDGFRGGDGQPTDFRRLRPPPQDGN